MHMYYYKYMQYILVSYWYYYCIGYASNDWSTSEVPLDQYQERLIIRREEALHKGIYTHTIPCMLYYNVGES